MVKQETRRIRMWLECVVRSDCASWSLDLSHGALLPCGAGGMECRAWTPPLDLLGWGRAALHAHVAEQPSAIHSSHCHLMLVPLVSLARVDSEVILPFWWDIDVSVYWDSIAQMRSAPPYLFLWGRKHLTCVHTAWFRDQVLWYPIFTEKMNQDVAASVSRRSGKTTGGWWNIRDDLSAARSPVCSFFQGQGRGRRYSIWTFWA